MPNPTPTSRPGDVAKSTREVYRTLSLSSVGLEMGISVILGLLAGRWADGKLGSTPWLLILGCFLGLAAGFKGVFRAMKESDRIAAENERERGGEA